MTTLLRNSLSLLCLCLLAASAAYGQNVAPELNLTLGEQRVRFAPSRSFQEMRLEVVNSVGEIVFAHTTTEAEFDWNLRAANSEALAPGLYRYALTLKFGEDQSRQHTGHFIVEKGQDQIWLTASDGTEVSGTTLNASRTGGRSIAGLGRTEDKSVKRDVSGRELVDEKGNKLTDEKKAVKQEKAALLGTLNKVAKFGVSGNADTDSTIFETASGFVGIGTTAPTGALHVFSTAVNPLQVQMTGVGGAALTAQMDNYGGSGASGGSGFLGRAANGSIGVPANVAPGDRLGFNVFGGYAGGAFRHTVAINGLVGTGTVSASSLPSYLNFMTTPDGSVGRLERMRIDQNGNVGIGTTAPTERLHVVGANANTTRFQGATHVPGGDITTLVLDGFGANFGTNSITKISARDNGVSGADLSFHTNNLKRMTILNSGNVGIGTTAPVAKLEVAGEIRMSAGPGDITGTNGLSPHSGTGGFLFLSGLPGSGINRMTITNSGNVGIGTTPASRFHVAGNSLFATSGTNGVHITPDNDATDGVLNVTNNANTVSWLKVGNNGQVVMNGGLVGIGVTPSAARLHVGGAAGSYTRGDSVGFSYSCIDFTYVLCVAPPGTFGASIYADASIITNSNFVAVSDQRIKRRVGRSDAARDLATLASIEVTDYTLIDTIVHGPGQQKKVIAQQVEAVYPQAVSQRTGTVPDIYQRTECQDGWIKLATNLQKGERVRLIGDKTDSVYEVLEVGPDKFRTDFVPDGKAVFVYGREVKDFRSVDYDAISMLNVSATQELHRLMGQKDAEIKALRAEKDDEIKALAERLAGLELMLQQLTQQTLKSQPKQQ